MSSILDIAREGRRNQRGARGQSAQCSRQVKKVSPSISVSFVHKTPKYTVFPQTVFFFKSMTSTLESRINVPLQLLISGFIFQGLRSYYEFKRLKFYYISLYILRGYVYSFFQRLHCKNYKTRVGGIRVLEKSKKTTKKSNFIHGRRNSLKLWPP